jgi:hypothetical protein
MTPAKMFVFVFVVALTLIPVAPAWSEHSGSEHIERPRNSTVAATLFPSPQGVSVHGTVGGDDGDIYILPGKAGQRLILSFAATIPDACFSVSAPNSPDELFEGSSGQSSLDMILSETGPYRIEVYLMEGAGKRRAVADYRLGVRLVSAP